MCTFVVAYADKLHQQISGAAYDSSVRILIFCSNHGMDILILPRQEWAAFC